MADKPGYTVHNLTPHTCYCVYCGTEIRPGRWHECSGLYREEEEEERDAE